MDNQPNSTNMVPAIISSSVLLDGELNNDTESQIPRLNNEESAITLNDFANEPINQDYDKYTESSRPRTKSHVHTISVDGSVDFKLNDELKDEFGIPPVGNQLTLTDIKEEDNEGKSIFNEFVNTMTIKNPPKNLWRVIAGCLWTASLGMSDGAPGALLAHIEEYYDIGYAVVSLIWLGNSIGFIVIALASHKINLYLGRHMVITIGCSLMILMYSLISWGPPFPVIVVAFFFGGLGMASVLTQHNMFLSNFDKADAYLGYFHGMYGLGATIAPILATAMVSNGVKWSYYYFITLFFACFNTVFGYISFDNCAVDTEQWFGKEERYISKKKRRELEDKKLQEKSALEVEEVDVHSERRSFIEIIEENCVAASIADKKTIDSAFHCKETWLLAVFTLLYQGAEVAMGGWIDIFLIRYRGGNPSTTGYVASGYWGGLCIGRLFLTKFFCGMGPRFSVSLLCVAIIVLTILVWTIPNVIGAAVCVSFVGVAMGPIYPLLITVTVEILPKNIQLVAMTLITAFGSTGGALFPFLVGITSQFTSTYVVHPFVISLTAAMLIMWLVLPNVDHIIIKRFKNKKIERKQESVKSNEMDSPNDINIEYEKNANTNELPFTELNNN